MATGFTYSSFLAALVTQIPSLPDDPNYLTILPTAIDYAETSICRDLDMHATYGLLPLGTLTIGNPTLNIPDEIIVIEQLLCIVDGISKVLTSVSYPALTALYAPRTPTTPQVWCPSPNTQIGGPFVQQVLVGPPPDFGYSLLAFGTSRPTPLSAANTTTYIATQYPDLFWAGAMIFLAGYNRNFGAMGAVDDPGQGVSWRAEYARLLSSAKIEESRRQFRVPAATAPAPPAAAAR